MKCSGSTTYATHMKCSGSLQIHIKLQPITFNQNDTIIPTPVTENVFMYTNNSSGVTQKYYNHRIHTVGLVFYFTLLFISLPLLVYFKHHNYWYKVIEQNRI